MFGDPTNACGPPGPPPGKDKRRSSESSTAGASTTSSRFQSSVRGMMSPLFACWAPPMPPGCGGQSMPNNATMSMMDNNVCDAGPVSMCGPGDGGYYGRGRPQEPPQPPAQARQPPQPPRSPPSSTAGQQQRPSSPTQDQPPSSAETKDPPPQQQLEDIVSPHPHDVLCGRGGSSNRHVGNLNFRSLVSANKSLYVTLTKKQKMQIARKIVQTVKNQDPPGRFLQKGENGLWNDIGLPRSLEKTSQALREKTSGEKAEKKAAGSDNSGAPSAVSKDENDETRSSAGSNASASSTFSPTKQGPEGNVVPLSPVTPAGSATGENKANPLVVPEITIPVHLQAQFDPHGKLRPKHSMEGRGPRSSGHPDDPYGQYGSYPPPPHARHWGPEGYGYPTHPHGDGYGYPPHREGQAYLPPAHHGQLGVEGYPPHHYPPRGEGGPSYHPPPYHHSSSALTGGISGQPQRPESVGSHIRRVSDDDYAQHFHAASHSGGPPPGREGAVERNILNAYPPASQGGRGQYAGGAGPLPSSGGGRVGDGSFSNPIRHCGPGGSSIVAPPVPPSERRPEQGGRGLPVQQLRNAPAPPKTQPKQQQHPQELTPPSQLQQSQRQKELPSPSMVQRQYDIARNRSNPQGGQRSPMPHPSEGGHVLPRGPPATSSYRGKSGREGEGTLPYRRQYPPPSEYPPEEGPPRHEHARDYPPDHHLSEGQDGHMRPPPPQYYRGRDPAADERERRDRGLSPPHYPRRGGERGLSPPHYPPRGRDQYPSHGEYQDYPPPGSRTPHRSPPPSSSVPSTPSPNRHPNEGRLSQGGGHYETPEGSRLHSGRRQYETPPQRYDSTPPHYEMQAGPPSSRGGGKGSIWRTPPNQPRCPPHHPDSAASSAGYVRKRRMSEGDDSYQSNSAATSNSYHSGGGASSVDDYGNLSPRHPSVMDEINYAAKDTAEGGLNRDMRDKLVIVDSGGDRGVEMSYGELPSSELRPPPTVSRSPPGGGIGQQPQFMEGRRGPTKEDGGMTVWSRAGSQKRTDRKSTPPPKDRAAASASQSPDESPTDSSQAAIKGGHLENGGNDSATGKEPKKALTGLDALTSAAMLQLDGKG